MQNAFEFCAIGEIILGDGSFLFPKAAYTLKSIGLKTCPSGLFLNPFAKLSLPAEMQKDYAREKTFFDLNQF
jgi:hypothetical protein